MQSILLRVLLLAAAELAAMYATFPPGWNDVQATSLSADVFKVADRCAVDADAFRARKADLLVLGQAGARPEQAMLVDTASRKKPLQFCLGFSARAGWATRSAGSHDS